MSKTPIAPVVLVDWLLAQKWLGWAGVVLWIASCAHPIPIKPPAPSTAFAATCPILTTVKPMRFHDDSSYAQPDRVVIRHIDIDLAVQPTQQQLSGRVTYTLEWKDCQADTLVLDTRALHILQVDAIDAQGQTHALAFRLSREDPIFGSRLTIASPGQPQQLRIRYQTDPRASGLQWLDPIQTVSKRQPMLFSQSQAIHARSWLPLQDTPSVRFTYRAHISAPQNLRVLMSASHQRTAQSTGDFWFEMPQPIPSYLLAIAVGDFVFKPISSRAGVWAEPAMIDTAAQEFSDTEKMIRTVEQMFGPYRWGRYDILILPPSFPFGGMENPRLTFLTPTVIVGDKSLVSVVAHELAHSWSGNLVTNAAWNDIWLNEGFTTYVQARITEAVYGKDAADLERQTDQLELRSVMAQLSAEEQILARPALGNRDPDAVLSQVPYVKGAWFLEVLERRYGREQFDAFLRAWFQTYAFQSVDTATFVDFLKTHLMQHDTDTELDHLLHAWLYEPGIPSTAPAAQARGLAHVATAVKQWQEQALLPNPSEARKWNVFQWVYFLEHIGPRVSLQKLKELDNAFHFTGTLNPEIAQRWYPLAMRSGDRAVWGEASQFLMQVGRMKCILPVYTAMAQTADGCVFARQTFAKAYAFYHPITRTAVAAVLEQASQKVDCVVDQKSK